MTRVVAITGASSGVGRATARAFAAEGADIALLARGREGLEAAAKEVEAAGGRALALQVDVADPDAVEAAAAVAEERLGPLDVWVNNAMTAVLALVRETSPAEFKRVTEVTYLGVVHGTLAALRRMQPRDRGVIVQVGSALAFRSIPLQASYCAAKHAVEGFTEALRCELLHEHSRVRARERPPPGAQHPPVRPCQDHAAEPPPTGARPSTSPSSRRGAITWAAATRGARCWWAHRPR